MKLLSVQIQPDRVKNCNASDFIQKLRELAVGLIEDVAIADGQYININFTTDNTSQLWQRLQPEFKQNLLLARCSIVCCEGQNGWDNYLLLHHFDSTLVLDVV